MADIEIDLQGEKEQEETRLLDEVGFISVTDVLTNEPLVTTVYSNSFANDEVLLQGDAEHGDRLERRQMDAGTALTRGGSVFDPGSDFMALNVEKTVRVASPCVLHQLCSSCPVKAER